MVTGAATEVPRNSGQPPLAAAVCLSRVCLGVHFPLDAIAGAGLGMFIGAC
jgi:membrane-associated phospholipid phosphatase